VPSKAIIRLTSEQWLAEGHRLFGENFEDWRFICPICNQVQSVGDFKPFKDSGATPDTARYNCLGRFLSASERKASGRCDYTLGGLIRLPGVIVTDGDREYYCFSFADAEVKQVA
jgi:hypothetical protein